MSTTTQAIHTTFCIEYAINLAEENGAEDWATALEWVTSWEADGGLDNYGACTCARNEGIEVARESLAHYIARH